MTDKLSASAQKVQDALTARGFGAMQVLELPASTRTAQEAADAIGCTVAQIAKSLIFRATESDAPLPTGTSVLGQDAPDPMGSPKTTKQHIVDQHCLSNCASIARNCDATADDATAKKRCADQKTKCDSTCQ